MDLKSSPQHLNKGSFFNEYFRFTEDDWRNTFFKAEESEIAHSTETQKTICGNGSKIII